MKLQELRNLMADVTGAMRNEADAVDRVTPHLVEMPEGVAYQSLQSYPLKQYAELSLELLARNREKAIEAATLYPPCPMRYFPKDFPHFRPSESSAGGLGIPVYPLVFQAYYMERTHGASPHAAKLCWYHKTKGGDIILIGTAIINDVARVAPNQVEALPAGHAVIDDELINGMRTASVHWDATTSHEQFVNAMLSMTEDGMKAPDVEWPSLIDG